MTEDLKSGQGNCAERGRRGATCDRSDQQHFQDGSWNYSTDVATAVDSDGLLEFLTKTKTGFCQHYTTAMTVMVRTLGIPARVAVGYRSGTLQEDGSYLVQTDDVHGWVEVLFPGYGWLEFEPEAGTAHPNEQPGTYLSGRFGSRLLPDGPPRVGGDARATVLKRRGPTSQGDPWSTSGQGADDTQPNSTTPMGERIRS